MSAAVFASFAANPFAARPLHICVLDPVNRTVIKSFILLGSVSRSVLDAAQHGAAGRWSAADGSILRGQYGSDWRALLSPELGAKSVPALEASELEFFLGGAAAEAENDPAAEDDFAEYEFAGLEDFDAPGGLAEAPPRGATGRRRQEPLIARHAALTPGPALYSGQAVYPEDTFEDLRHVISAASGIPLFRQHMFYTTQEGGSGRPYRVLLDGAEVGTDVVAAFSRGSGDTVFGFPVERRLAERKDGIQVHTLEPFTRLGDVPGGLRVVFIVDLYSVLPPGEQGSQLRDKYQFDLLYYGGVVRFWPQLSPDALLLALTQPDSVAEFYPSLDPDPDKNLERLAIAQRLMDAAHAYRSPAKGVRVAVTQASVRVPAPPGRGLLIVRNVFDWTALSPELLAAAVRFIEVSVAGAGGLAAQHGLYAEKRHVASYAPRVAPAVDKFLASAARQLHVGEVAFAISRRGADGAASGALATLVIRSDGQYTVETDWREDANTSFDAAIAEAVRLAAPIAEQVKSLGAAGFVTGGPLASGDAATVGGSTAVAFWPHSLTADGFRQLKARLKDYERAGILAVKGLQQAGSLVLMFRKGVTGFDPAQIDRFFAASRRGLGAENGKTPGAKPPPGQTTADIALPSGTLNRYAYLADPNVALRWATLYGGRTVRLTHRVTDVRFEVLAAADLEEFRVVATYLLAFLDGLLAGPKTARLKSPAFVDFAKGAERDKRLRRLQERDPNLYDLKKYDPAARVYSMLCQAKHQPHIYTPEEAAALPAKERAALVRYWNFTEQRPAYYRCPMAAYPHVSFRAGQHPLGYCLVCCRRSLPAVGSKAALSNNECQKRWLTGRAEEAPDGSAPAPPLDPGAEPDPSTRHILTYGKQIPLGRIAELPRLLKEGLFLGVMPPPYGLYLVGVEQSAPAVPSAGFLYSVAAALTEAEDGPEQVVAELAATAVLTGDGFRSLGGGRASVFPTAESLGSALIEAFCARSLSLNPFSPGGAAADALPEIVADLARLRFGVVIVRLEDPDGLGDPYVVGSAATALAISRGALPDGGLRVALIFGGPSGTYPVFALHARKFLKAPLKFRWLASRRTFTVEPDRAANETPVEGQIPDSVGEVLREVFAAGQGRESRVSLPQGEVRGKKLIDLPVLLDFAKAAALEVTAKRVGLRGLCYGADVRTREGELAFIPVRLSPSVSDGVPIEFTPRKPAEVSRSALTAFVGELNRWIGERRPQYAQVESAADLVDHEGAVVGFVARDAAPHPLYFYHRAQPPAADAASPFVRLPYPPAEIDAAIFAATGSTGAFDAQAHGFPALAAAASKTRAANRLYRLLVAEFSAAIAAERNKERRAQLNKIIDGVASFSSAPELAKLYRGLAAAVQDSPGDRLLLLGVVRAARRAATADPKAAIRAAIARTRFAFDRLTVARLRALGSHEAVVEELRRLLDPRVRLTHGRDEQPETKTTTVLGDGNMYAACSAASSLERPQCDPAAKALLVPREKYPALLDILAADLVNPYRADVIASASAGVFDAAEFIQRPGEHLAVARD